MGAKGRDFLIQLETAIPGTYATIGGLRSNSFSVNNEQIDITDKDGSGWKQLLEGGGVQAVSLKGSGVSKNSTTLAAIREASFDNTHVSLKLVSALGFSFTGMFAVTSFEGAGEYNKEETFSVSLDSAGDVTYSAGV